MKPMIAVVRRDDPQFLLESSEKLGICADCGQVMEREYLRLLGTGRLVCCGCLFRV